MRTEFNAARRRMISLLAGTSQRVELAHRRGKFGTGDLRDAGRGNAVAKTVANPNGHREARMPLADLL